MIKLTKSDLVLDSKLSQIEAQLIKIPPCGWFATFARCTCSFFCALCKNSAALIINAGLLKYLRSGDEPQYDRSFVNLAAQAFCSIHFLIPTYHILRGVVGEYKQCNKDSQDKEKFCNAHKDLLLSLEQIDQIEQVTHAIRGPTEHDETRLNWARPSREEPILHER
jgi:hypothetical protein